MTMKRFLFLWMVFMAFAPGFGAAQPQALPPLKVRGIWLHPADAGHNPAEVAAFVSKAADAHINTIVLLVKAGGTLYFHSQFDPEDIAPAYRQFDLLQAVITEAHKHGIKVHAWLTDYLESPEGYAYRHHPEWAALNPEGKTTLSETLGPHRPYPNVWMCPARRPGYTDQFLLPLIREIVTRYDVDGIHHDYVRYPGDVNPDGYCFCDFCLSHIFAHSHLVYEAAPHITPLERLLPRVDADLSRDYTPQPPHWDRWSRREKANFLLHGRYEYDSAPDMSYFFYTYRTDAIKRFARESYELVKSLRPQVVISAAVFKNPETSGRYIGQRWTDWTQYVDEFMPMTYRSHFSVDWPTFLSEFGEYTRYQKRWADRSQLDQGIAIHYLYREMYDPLNEINATLDHWLERQDAGGQERGEVIHLAQTTLAQLPAGPRKQEFERALKALPQALNSEADRKGVLALQALCQRLINDPPPGFYPPQRLTEAIRVARENGAEGIVLFAGGDIVRDHLWNTVKEAFDDRSRPPERRPSD
jgi:uncharacterized lipoprotein YddW (UPF0748 family)